MKVELDVICTEYGTCSRQDSLESWGVYVPLFPFKTAFSHNTTSPGESPRGKEEARVENSTHFNTEFVALCFSRNGLLA